LLESVALQSQLREAVVAAIELGERTVYWRLLDTLDTPNPGVNWRFIEIVVAQTGAPSQECLGSRGAAMSEPTNDCKVGD
jgi:hypothetical protein